MSLHPSHRTRFSDASSFDEICMKCGRTDQVPGGWGLLAELCPVSDGDYLENLETKVEQQRLAWLRAGNARAALRMFLGVPIGAAVLRALEAAGLGDRAAALANARDAALVVLCTCPDPPPEEGMPSTCPVHARGA